MKDIHLYIIGHARHGKDTVGKILSRDYKLDPCDSSWFMAERAVFPALKHKYGYNTVLDCYTDRFNHRREWFKLIEDANPFGYEISVELFKKHRVYTGMRSARELNAVREHPDLNPFVVWVDASRRLPPESPESMTVSKLDADYIIDNNGEPSLLHPQIATLMSVVLPEFACELSSKDKRSFEEMNRVMGEVYGRKM